MLALRKTIFLFAIILYCNNLSEQQLPPAADTATIARANSAVYSAKTNVSALRTRAAIVENQEMVVKNLLNEIEDLDPEIVKELSRLTVIAKELPLKVTDLEEILNVFTVMSQNACTNTTHEDVVTSPSIEKTTQPIANFSEELQPTVPDAETIELAQAIVSRAKSYVSAVRARATLIENAEIAVSNLLNELRDLDPPCITCEPNWRSEFAAKELPTKLTVLEYILNNSTSCDTTVTRLPVTADTVTLTI